MRLPKRHAPMLVLLAILLVAALLRAWLIAGERVSFDSDEAVVGLMARHIAQGRPIPTFYYGQAYMGSLDALLVAGGFALGGESVATMRAVQLVLALLALLAAHALARTVTGSRRVALMALLLLAIPTPLGALYGTATLGGYNELILLGSLVLLWSWQIAVEGRDAPWRWAALGLAAGIGWWVNAAIIVSIGVAGLVGLRTLTRRPWRGYALCAAAFLLGSAPWWLYNLGHDWASLDFLLGGFGHAPDADPVSRGEALVALIGLGLPALYGLRLPWEAGFALGAGTFVAALVYAALVTDWLAGSLARLRALPHPRPALTRLAAPSPPAERGQAERSEAGGEVNSAPPSRGKGRGWGAYDPARRWVWMVFGVFAAVFLLSPFTDATGRYLLPLWVPAAMGVALGLDRLRRAGKIVAAGALAALLAAQAGTVIRAAQTETGLTPQLVEALRVPARYDGPLLDFLAAEGYAHGYAAYWTSFRLIFRSGEALILDTALPYDAQGNRPVTDRYPPYRAQVEAAARVVWITQNFPALDARIAAGLGAAGVSYQTRDFGPYRVYYDFSRRVSPRDFGLD
ncbi:MAG: glycosyltransferase family 39 protein, partial [Anaerolineae bacterium]|nr:glycosyltransferase family 39 protein [Anaerolineae bacterium]